MKKLENIFAWMVKIGLFVIPFLPLYVSGSMLFPFITGKNFWFRIITETIFILWVWLAITNPEFRPKLTRLLQIITLFIFVIFLADLFGSNPYRSFFSNYERMEGFMMLGHLYLYYIMLSSVFRKRDWMIFFHSTLAASLLVSYIGLLQKMGLKVSLQGGFRVDSTIGNPTYLAAYLLFHIWILLILMYTFRKKWWALGLYALALLFELMIVYFTATRGAIIGLVAAGVPLAALVVWQWSRVFRQEQKEKATAWPLGRKIAATVLGFVIVLPIVFWLCRNTSLVQSNQVLRRLTNYSLQEGTVQARFHIWGQSWKGFLERPILGWGQENYYLVFQKYYDPHLWGDEPWFDRSHNIFFDWLIHTGILGLAAYLGIYAVLFRSLIHGIEKIQIPLWHGMIVLAALFAHILQNLFVFDNLNTYLLFFGFIAYGSFLLEESMSRAAGTTDVIGAERTVGTVSPRRARTSARTYSRANAVVVALAVMLIASGYYLHVKPMQQSQALIRALVAYQEKVSMQQQIDAFKEALSYDSFGNTEVREQIINMGRNIPGNQRFSNAEQKQYIEFAIDEMRKETDHSAKDVKHVQVLGSLLNQMLNMGDAQYIPEAKRVLEEAVTLSPTKQPVAFELAQFYLVTGNSDAARDLVYRAWKLDPTYQVAGIHTWVLAVVTNKPEIAAEVSKMFPLTSLSETDLIRLGEAYRRIKDYPSALPFYGQLVVSGPGNPKYRATYAALLANAGRIAEAREQAQAAIALDPSFGKDANSFLQNLNNE